MATKTQEYDFAPSRELSIVGGILAGLKARHDKMKVREAEQAKAQQSFMRIYMPLLMKQKQFEQTEQRERFEFEKEFGLQTRQEKAKQAQQAITSEQRFIELGFTGQRLQATLNDMIATREQEAKEFELEQEKLKLTERGVVSEEKRVEIAKRAGELQELRDLRDHNIALQRELGIERRHVETIESQEEMAKLNRELTREEGTLDRELKRELAAVAFSPEEQTTVDAYKEALAEYKTQRDLMINPDNEPESNYTLQQAYSTAVDELIRVGQVVAPIFQAHNQPAPFIPGFRVIPGRKIAWWPDVDMQVVPRETVPVLTPSQRAPEAPVPAGIDQGKPRTSVDVNAAVAAAQEGKKTVLSESDEANLRRLGYTDEDIAEINRRLAVK